MFRVRRFTDSRGFSRISSDIEGNLKPTLAMFSLPFGALSVRSAAYWPSARSFDMRKISRICIRPVVFASLVSTPALKGVYVVANTLIKGAAAVLEYSAVRSPLAQPRAAILGHTLAAIVGVALTKLFMLRGDYDDIRWIAGPFVCAASSAVMTMTNTVHPPGGATALLAAIDPDHHQARVEVRPAGAR